MSDLSSTIDGMGVEALEDTLRMTLKRTAKETIQIGYLLKKLKEKGGFDNWASYVQEKFQISESAASRFMALNEKYGNRIHGMEIDSRYQDMSTGVLIEMLNMPPELEAQVTPDMTVKQVREIKKQAREPEPEEIPAAEFRDVEIATSQENKPDEDTECPPDIHNCIRQEWGTRPEQQAAGHKECEKCWAAWKKQQKILGNVTTDANSSAQLVKDEAWFVKEYIRRYPEKLNDLMRICREHKNNVDKAKAIQRYEAPYGYRGNGNYEFSVTFRSFTGGIDFDTDTRAVTIHMTYVRFVEEMLKLYDPYATEFADELQKEAKENQCISGKSPYGSCVCCHDGGMKCCAECSEYCNSRCGWLEEINSSDVAQEFPQEPEQEEPEIYTARYFLDEQRQELEEYLECSGLPEKLMARQRTIVEALAAMVAEQESGELPVEQPEFPQMKNMDQREDFINSFHDWPVWCRIELTEEVFYRYNLPDGSAIIVKEYPYTYWKGETNGKVLYLLKPDTKHFKDAETSMTTIKEYLKGVRA